MPNFSEGIGTKRQQLKEHLDSNHKDVATLYHEMTPEEKAVGKLIGKLLGTGFGFQQVDDAFSWWEIEHNKGEKLHWDRKNIALMETIGTLTSIATEEGYRVLRKILVTLNQKN
jgi:hypothetical protein